MSQSNLASRVLKALQYDITYPLAPSSLLIAILRFKNASSRCLFERPKCTCKSVESQVCNCAQSLPRVEPSVVSEGAAILVSVRAMFAVALLVSWVHARMYPSVVDEMDSTTVPQSYGMSLFFYFALHLIVAAQNHIDATHLLSTGPVTHLVIWILHSFTCTVILASTVSFIVYPGVIGASYRGADIALVSWGMGLELLLSAWKIHAYLVAFTLSWSALIAGAVVAYKTNMHTDPTNVADAFSSALIGLGLIAGAFVFIWVVVEVRELVFPSSCWEQGCCCKAGVEEMGFNGNATQVECEDKKVALV
ncbi:hypothetical protein BJ741DRAFT_339081 [Chytriomyces cf. hyalinus JEL632]|nr:hypothetical protein BJ741DRAFT_339081 [Chytriomyces cf. hyalinus JEL632]